MYSITELENTTSKLASTFAFAGASAALARVTHHREDPVVVRFAGFVQIKDSEVAGPDGRSVPGFNAAAERTSVFDGAVVRRRPCFRCGS